MARISLNDLTSAVDVKYSPFDVELPSGDIVTLRPVLRMPKTDRKALSALQAGREDRPEDAEDDSLEYIQAFIQIVVGNQDRSQALFDAVGDDLAVLSEIVGEYVETTQPGEAPSSES